MTQSNISYRPKDYFPSKFRYILKITSTEFKKLKVSIKSQTLKNLIFSNKEEFIFVWDKYDHQRSQTKTMWLFEILNGSLYLGQRQNHLCPHRRKSDSLVLGIWLTGRDKPKERANRVGDYKVQQWFANFRGELLIFQTLCRGGENCESLNYWFFC